MSWKDKWREEKKASGLTWDEYHEQKFIHVDEVTDLGSQIGEIDDLRHVIDRLESRVNSLQEQLEATEQTYKDMHREVFEQGILAEYEDD